MEFVAEMNLVHKKMYNAISCTDTKEVKAANEWLQEFQDSKHAVVTLDALLLVEPAIFRHRLGAEYLWQVVQKGIPTLMHKKLYSTLKARIVLSTSTARSSTITKLAMTLFNVWFQMDAVVRPAFSELMNIFAEKQKILQEVLFSIPTEFDNCKQMQEILVEASPLVLDFWLRYGQVNNERFLRYFGMWIEKQFIQAELLGVNSPLMREILRILREENTPEELHEAAMLCVQNLLTHFMDSNYGSQLMKQWYIAICFLEDTYNESVLCKSEAKMRHFTLLFTTLCNMSMEKVLSGKMPPAGLLKVVNIVLNNIANVNFEDAQVHYEFWIHLCYALRQTENATLAMMFQPTLKHLLKLICKHAEIDAEHQGLIMLQPGSFNYFRDMASRLVQQLAEVMGHMEYFSELMATLQTTTSWESVESALFLMQKVARNIRYGDRHVMIDVMSFLISLVDNPNIALLYTSIQLVGALSNWLQDFSYLLPQTISFLRSFLGTSGLKIAAANALISIFEASNRNIALQNLNDLLTIADNIARANIFRTNKEQLIGLLERISQLLASLPSVAVSPVLRKIVRLQLKPLNELTPARTYAIDCIIASLRHIHPRQPGMPAILVDIWVLVPKLLLRYQTDGYTMERTCCLLRLACSFAQAQNCIAVETLNSLIKELSAVYTRYPHICILRLAPVLVKLCASNPACQQTLLNMLSDFIKPGLATNKSCLRSCQELLNLGSSFIAHLPVVFLHNKLLKSVVERALGACSVGHTALNLSAMTFLCNLLRCQHQSAYRSAVQGIARQYGGALLKAALDAPLKKPAVHSTTTTVDIIIELKVLVSREEFAGFVEALTSEMPKKNNEECFNVLATTLKSNDANSISAVVTEFIRLYQN